MLGRLIFNRIGAVILGLLAVGAGLYLLSATEVKCGDEVMTPDDICVTIDGSTETERTYEEQKSQNALTSYVTLGVGGVVLVGGIVANIRHFTKKKETPETPVAAA